MKTAPPDEPAIGIQHHSVDNNIRREAMRGADAACAYIRSAATRRPQSVQGDDGIGSGEAKS